MQEGWYSLLQATPSNNWGKSKCTPHNSELNGRMDQDLLYISLMYVRMSVCNRFT